MENIICNWSTYSRSQCRRNILHEAYTDNKRSKFCQMHFNMAKDFKRSDKDTYCDTADDIYICPRSYKYLMTQLNELEYDTTNVDVINGKIIEEADISNEDYILLLSDEKRCHYNIPKEINKLKVKLKKFCKNLSIISYDNNNYCEDCFKKLKGVPKLSCIL